MKNLLSELAEIAQLAQRATQLEPYWSPAEQIAFIATGIRPRRPVAAATGKTPRPQRKPPPPPTQTPTAADQQLIWASITIARHGQADAGAIIRDPEAYRKAKREAARNTHPDRNRGETRLFQEVNAAAEILERYHRL